MKPTHSLDIQDCQVKNIDQAGSVAASPCGAVNSSALSSSRGSIGTPIVSGSNGGTKFAKVLLAGTEVVMQQVAIPPCAVVNSLGSIGTSVASSSNDGA